MKHFLLFSLLFIEISVFGQKDFDTILNKFHAEKNFNGSVVVSKKGRIEYSNALGRLDIQKRKWIKKQTKFKIAGLTKTFTAVLILQLHQQGKINLKSRFGRYFHRYKGNAKNQVTIEQLLTGNSGIPDQISPLKMKSFETPLSIDEYIDRFCSSDIDTTAGENNNDRITEFVILTKIIENITQKKYETVLYENILKPLRMKRSGMLDSKHQIICLAKSFSIYDSTNAAVPDEPYFIENYFGAGAMYSTAEDLQKFYRAIFKNKLLLNANTELLLKPKTDHQNSAFGLRYENGFGAYNLPFIYQTGSILGASSSWIYTLDDQRCIIILNNTNGTDLFEMSEELYIASKNQIDSQVPLKFLLKLFLLGLITS